MQIILLIIIRENNVDETPHEQNKKRNANRSKNKNSHIL